MLEYQQLRDDRPQAFGVADSWGGVTDSTAVVVTPTLGYTHSLYIKGMFRGAREFCSRLSKRDSGTGSMLPEA